MNDQVVMYRWLSIGLAIALALVIVGWLLFNNQNNPEKITQNFRKDARDYGEEIRTKCTFSATTTPADRKACETALEDFSDIIRQYRNDMEEATGTTTLPLLATSSPQTTSVSGSVIR